jgi:hypothetical protein
MVHHVIDCAYRLIDPHQRVPWSLINAAERSRAVPEDLERASATLGLILSSSGLVTKTALTPILPRLLFAQKMR